MTSRKFLLLIGLTVLVFAGLAAYGDFQDVGGRLAHFPVTHLAAGLALALLNYILRFGRWAYYLRVLNIRVPFGLNGLVFLSGLAMSITPGKAGELLKCYMLRDRVNVPVAASVPVVVMERLTDVLSVVLLALIGLALLPVQVVWVLAAALVLSVAGFGIFASRGDSRLLGLPFLRRWRDEILISQEGFRRLAAPRVMAVGVILGTLAWFSEGAALWVVLQGLGADVYLLRALPIYAAATLVGAVTTLPGGLIGTEGSMVALLQQSGMDKGLASGGTLLVRLMTLWFAVAIGVAALALLHRFSPVRDAPEAGTEADGPALRTPQ